VNKDEESKKEKMRKTEKERERERKERRKTPLQVRRLLMHDVREIELNDVDEKITRDFYLLSIYTGVGKANDRYTPVLIIAFSLLYSKRKRIWIA
jgi:hypothetical protein